MMYIRSGRHLGSPVKFEVSVTVVDQNKSGARSGRAWQRVVWAGLLALGLGLGLGPATQAHADGQIFLCTDADGRKELTDTMRKGNCKALDLPGALSAPVKRPGGAAPRSGAASGSPAPAAVTPADFPRVDNAAQKARDADRRQILLDELASEEAKLAALRKEYNGGEPERNGNERNYAKYQERVALMKENLSRAEKNVEALQREIASTR